VCRLISKELLIIYVPLTLFLNQFLGTRKINGRFHCVSKEMRNFAILCIGHKRNESKSISLTTYHFKSVTAVNTVPYVMSWCESECESKSLSTLCLLRESKYSIVSKKIDDRFDIFNSPLPPQTMTGQTKLRMGTEQPTARN
jgi:hypothetical protein